MVVNLRHSFVPHLLTLVLHPGKWNYLGGTCMHLNSFKFSNCLSYATYHYYRYRYFWNNWALLIHRMSMTQSSSPPSCISEVQSVKLSLRSCIINVLSLNWLSFPLGSSSLTASSKAAFANLQASSGESRIS